MSSSHMQIPDAELIAEAGPQHAAEPVEIVFDDDVPTWCAERNGQYCGNPVAMAIRDVPTGTEYGLAVEKALGDNCMRIVRWDYPCHHDATPLRRSWLDSYQAWKPT